MALGLGLKMPEPGAGGLGGAHLGSHLILENGDHILSEDGSGFFLLE
jgi:hypothetical protein